MKTLVLLSKKAFLEIKMSFKRLRTIIEDFFIDVVFIFAKESFTTFLSLHCFITKLNIFKHKYSHLWYETSMKNKGEGIMQKNKRNLFILSEKKKSFCFME